MKKEAWTAKKPLPYLYENFNVKCFTTDPRSMTKSILARIVNCFIKALNDATKLPKWVIIVPDGDVLKYIARGLIPGGAKRVSAGSLKWIITQMNRALEAKKENMFKKKPGSIVAEHPKIIWIEMFNRTNGYNKILALRSKYNESLHEEIRKFVNIHIMSVNKAMMDVNLYDRFNNLNGFGRIRFWCEVNSVLESFDKGEVRLRPFIRNQKRKQNFQQPYNRHNKFFKRGSAGKVSFKQEVMVQNDNIEEEEETDKGYDAESENEL